jgi:hypothetical protein
VGPGCFYAWSLTCYEAKKNGKDKCMYPPVKKSIRSQPKPVGLPERVAGLQRNLTTAAKLDPGNFWTEHSAISQNEPEQVTSLGKTGEPISIHWQDGPDAKVLIRNLDRLDGGVGTGNITETILAHIKKFQQDGLPLPKEIYLDVRKSKPSQRNLDDFENKLVEGINELNNTNYEINPEEVDEGYIKLNLGTRQAEEPISRSGRKSASGLIESDSDSEGIELSPLLVRRQSQTEGLDQSADEGATRSARRSETGVDERPQDQAVGVDTDTAILPKLVSEVLSGAQDVRDEALGLSEGNMQLLEGLKGMYDNLLVTKQRLLDLERQIEATLPPALPLDTLIGFQPDFRPLSAQTQEEAQQLAKSYKTKSSLNAPMNLKRILEDGLKPASRLTGVALSGDVSVANVVSVNVNPFSEDAKVKAEFAVTSRAGGAIPIALEQKGDTGVINIPTLSQRAVDSAMLIIDPDKLKIPQQQQVQQSQEGGGGELGLSDVNPGAIVAVLAPAPMVKTLKDRRVHFVGATDSSVYYAGAKKDVDLSHPDYQSALEQIFTDNPKKTLLTHTTRLGGPDPIMK